MSVDADKASAIIYRVRKRFGYAKLQVLWTVRQVFDQHFYLSRLSYIFEQMHSENAEIFCSWTQLNVSTFQFAEWLLVLPQLTGCNAHPDTDNLQGFHCGENMFFEEEKVIFPKSRNSHPMCSKHYRDCWTIRVIANKKNDARTNLNDRTKI